MNKANTLSCRCPGSHRPQVSNITPRGSRPALAVAADGRPQTMSGWDRQARYRSGRRLDGLIFNCSSVRGVTWNLLIPVSVNERGGILYLSYRLDLHIHNPFVQVQDLMDGDQNKAFQTSPALTCSKPSSYVLSLTQQSLAIYLNRLTYHTLLPSKLHPYLCSFSPFCKHLSCFDLLSFSWVMLAGLWDI